jgi:hypothetical protein
VVRITLNAKVAAVLGSILASSDIMEYWNLRGGRRSSVDKVHKKSKIYQMILAFEYLLSGNRTGRLYPSYF